MKIAGGLRLALAAAPPPARPPARSAGLGCLRRAAGRRGDARGSEQKQGEKAGVSIIRDLPVRASLSETPAPLHRYTTEIFTGE